MNYSRCTKLMNKLDVTFWITCVSLSWLKFAISDSFCLLFGYCVSLVLTRSWPFRLTHFVLFWLKIEHFSRNIIFYRFFSLLCMHSVHNYFLLTKFFTQNVIKKQKQMHIQQKSFQIHHSSRECRKTMPYHQTRYRNMIRHIWTHRCRRFCWGLLTQTRRTKKWSHSKRLGRFL